MMLPELSVPHGRTCATACLLKPTGPDGTGRPETYRGSGGIGLGGYSQANMFWYHLPLCCGNSSVGRARPCQGRGREFESRFPLQFMKPRTVEASVFRAFGGLPTAHAAAMARWQSGHAAACKAAYAGSIPTLASIARHPPVHRAFASWQPGAIGKRR